MSEVEPEPLDPSASDRASDAAAERYNDLVDKLETIDKQGGTPDERKASMIEAVKNYIDDGGTFETTTKTFGSKCADICKTFTDFISSFWGPGAETQTTVTLKDKNGAVIGQPIKLTIADGASYGEISQQFFEALDKTTNDVTFSDLAKVMTDDAVFEAKDGNGKIVKFGVKDIVSISDGVSEAFTDTNSPELAEQIKALRQELKEYMKQQPTTQTMGEARDYIADTVDKYMDKQEIKDLIDKAMDKYNNRTDIETAPKTKTTWWDTAKMIFTLACLAGLGIYTAIQIGAYCNARTGCMKVTAGPNGPIQIKIFCDDKQTYSEGLCACTPSTSLDVACSNSNACKCYPDQLISTSKRKNPQCDMKDDDFIYYTYVVTTPIDILDNLITDGGNFLSNAGSSILKTILKWAFMVFGIILGLVVIFYLVKFVAAKALKNTGK